MIISYFLKYVAILVLGWCTGYPVLLQCLSMLLYYPNRTETPVLKEEALLLMNKNIDVLEKALKLAATQVLP